MHIHQIVSACMLKCTVHAMLHIPFPCNRTLTCRVVLLTSKHCTLTEHVYTPGGASNMCIPPASNWCGGWLTVHDLVTTLQVHTTDQEAEPGSLHLSDIPSPTSYLPKLRKKLEHNHHHHRQHKHVEPTHPDHHGIQTGNAGLLDDSSEADDDTTVSDNAKPPFSKATRRILKTAPGENADIVSSLLAMNRELVEMLNGSIHRGVGIGVCPAPTAYPRTVAPR